VFPPTRLLDPNPLTPGLHSPSVQCCTPIVERCHTLSIGHGRKYIQWRSLALSWVPGAGNLAEVSHSNHLHPFPGSEKFLLRLKSCNKIDGASTELDHGMPSSLTDVAVKILDAQSARLRFRSRDCTARHGLPRFATISRSCGLTEPRTYKMQVNHRAPFSNPARCEARLRGS
jgi:hypothetical protein